ncbi:MAG TPA: helix-turn-helix domain-containing protein, partial [Pyrinomonadaceae bacterium]|nr:helix-turn-helix domain-containing protein [Pyrinomonadaceae bacterium]
KMRNASAGTSFSGNQLPTLEEMERRYVLETLQSSGEDKVAAAKRLGIDLSTLYRKLKRYEEI